jgi:hypothetical protein
MVANFRWTRRFCFAAYQAQKGLAPPDLAISKPINLKESTDLTVVDGDFQWSDPAKIAGDKNFLEAHNQTAEAQDISLCLEGESPSKRPEALLRFEHVGSQTTFQVEFTGQLRIYNVPSLHQDMSIECDTICLDRAEIVEPPISPPIWDFALHKPGLAENWTIVYNAKSGNFEIKEAE